MKTGRPGYVISSAETVSRDINGCLCEFAAESQLCYRYAATISCLCPTLILDEVELRRGTELRHRRLELVAFTVHSEHDGANRDLNLQAYELTYEEWRIMGDLRDTLKLRSLLSYLSI